MSFVERSLPPQDRDETPAAQPDPLLGLSLFVGEIDEAIAEARAHVDVLIQAQLGRRAMSVKLATEQVEELAVRAAMLCRVLSERISKFQQREARIR